MIKIIDTYLYFLNYFGGGVSITLEWIVNYFDPFRGGVYFFKKLGIKSVISLCVNLSSSFFLKFGYFSY